MKKCPRCMIVTDGKFCPDCGYDLSTVDTLICPKCGTESKSLFCPNCGTNMMNTSESQIIIDTSEAAKEGDISADENNNSVDDLNSGNEITGNSPAASKVSDNSSKGLQDILKQKPVIIGAAIAVVILILIGSLSSNNESKDTIPDTSTDTYSTIDESDNNTVSDSDYSSDSATYSTSDDGLSLIQGSWKMVGIVDDGESTSVGGLSVGNLEIYGDQWTLTISTTETTENSGTLYFEMKSDLDGEGTYYVYTMKSDGYSGSVKMAYFTNDNFIAVSTNSTLDSENCMMFSR